MRVGLGAKIGLGVEASPGFGHEKPMVAEDDILVTLLPFAIAPLEAKSLSYLLRTTKLCKRFFQ